VIAVFVVAAIVVVGLRGGTESVPGTPRGAPNSRVWVASARPMGGESDELPAARSTLAVTLMGGGEAEVCILGFASGASAECRRVSGVARFEVAGGGTYVITATSGSRSATRPVFAPIGATVPVSLTLVNVHSMKCSARDALGGEIAGATFISDVGASVTDDRGDAVVPIGASRSEPLVVAPGYASARATVIEGVGCVARLVPAGSMVGILDKVGSPATAWSSVAVEAMPSSGPALADQQPSRERTSHVPGLSGLVEIRPIDETTAAFRIDGLMPGAYRISAMGDDVSSAEDRLFEVGVGAEVDVGTVALTPQKGVIGTIHHGADPCNEGKAELSSVVRSYEASIQRGTTRFRSVPDGLYDVDVACEAPAGRRRIRSGIDLSSDRRTFDVDLAEGAAVTIRVVDEQANPVPDVVVSMREWGVSSAAAGRGTAQPVVLHGLTDANGETVLRGVVTEIRYGVTMAGDSVWASRGPAVKLYLEAGATAADVTLVVGRRATVGGLVLAGEDQRPVPGVELEFHKKDRHAETIPGGLDASAFSRGTRVTSDEDGSYETVIAEGNWTFEARDWSGAEIPIVSNDSVFIVGQARHVVDVTVDSTGGLSLHGRVRGAEGAQPGDAVIVGLKAEIASIAEGLPAVVLLGHGVILAMTDDVGRFKVDWIRPGAKVVAVGGRGEVSPIFTVTSAGTEALLEFAEVWSLTFDLPQRVVGSGVAWCVVSLSDGAVSSVWDRGQTRGVAIDVVGLPRGGYSMLARYGRTGEVARLDFVVPGTARLPLPFRDPLRLVGRLTRGGEPLPDWVVGSSGACFDDGAVVSTDLTGEFELELADPLPQRLVYGRPRISGDLGLRSMGSLPVAQFDADVRVLDLGVLEMD
jgi:hypothetical protein